MNQQPIEKFINQQVLQVHSMFYTIQGEGPFAGTPAVFVRLAGCNLQCPQCDTDYTSKREHIYPDEVVAQVDYLFSHKRGGLVVITGGEPFRQDLRNLCDELLEAGYYVQIESNGTLPPSDGIKFRHADEVGERYGVYLVCSPKTGSVNARIWESACAVKYVVSHTSQADDGLPVRALGHPNKGGVARQPEGYDIPVYLQPEDAKNVHHNLMSIEAVKDACLEHGYILQLQIHKLIGVE